MLNVSRQTMFVRMLVNNYVKIGLDVILFVLIKKRYNGIRTQNLATKLDHATKQTDPNYTMPLNMQHSSLSISRTLSSQGSFQSAISISRKRIYFAHIFHDNRCHVRAI